MYSLYNILGIEEGASAQAVESAYQILRTELDPGRFPRGSLAYRQAQQCLLAIEDAFGTLSNEKGRSAYEAEWRRAQGDMDEQGVQPKLGQMCVASGLITLEDLEHAVETQHQLDLPLGQILQEKLLISQAELDGMLLGQQLIYLPPDSPYSLGQRLIAIGLVTQDMVRIALIAQRTFPTTMEEQLLKHGWIAPEILEILQRQHSSRQGATTS